MKKADNGNRTRLPSLGSWCSTDELYLHEFIIALYKLLRKVRHTKNTIKSPVTITMCGKTATNHLTARL